MVAVDVNERARTLCAANAADNGIGNVEVLAPEAVDPALRFDAIWSNPPIRVGKAALHELLLTWLDRLTADGAAHLVVHKNLGSDSLQRWLTDAGLADRAPAVGEGLPRPARHPHLTPDRRVPPTDGCQHDRTDLLAPIGRARRGQTRGGSTAMRTRAPFGRVVAISAAPSVVPRGRPHQVSSGGATDRDPGDGPQLIGDLVAARRR